MTFAVGMIGVVLALFCFFPKTTGRHCAEIVRAYRKALDEPEPK